MHANIERAKHHKYISREWKNGHWIYKYEDDIKNDKSDNGNIDDKWNKSFEQNIDAINAFKKEINDPLGGINPNSGRALNLQDSSKLEDWQKKPVENALNALDKLNDVQSKLDYHMLYKRGKISSDSLKKMTDGKSFNELYKEYEDALTDFNNKFTAYQHIKDKRKIKDSVDNRLTK